MLLHSVRDNPIGNPSPFKSRAQSIQRLRALNFCIDSACLAHQRHPVGSRRKAHYFASVINLSTNLRMMKSTATHPPSIRQSRLPLPVNFHVEVLEIK